MSFKQLALTLGSFLGARQALKALQQFEPQDLLGYAGLQRRSETSAFSGLGLFVLGAAAGAGAALLLAPSSGAQLRSQLSARAGTAKERLQTKVSELNERVSNLANGTEAKLRDQFSSNE